MNSWVSTRYSPGLAKRRSAGTAPELVLRKALWRLGLRYRLHPRLGERLTADLLLLLRPRVCVFVDGCFWHQCPRHKAGPKGGPNADLWNAKFERTRLRDRRANLLASELGYSTVRLWECEITEHPDAAVAHVVEAIAKI